MLNFGSIAPYIPPAPGWLLAGNTLGHNDFLGSTNSSPIVFKVANNLAGKLSGNSIHLGSFSGNGENGQNHIGFGIRANENITGNNNIGIGYYANRQTNGSKNIGIGYQVGFSNSGSNCIFLGEEAGIGNTKTGIIALGYRAGYNNKGTGNFIGGNAGINNEGNTNICIGTESGGFSPPGSNLNVYIGSFSGRSNNANVKQQNVFLGHDAGNTNLGSYSVAVGNFALQGNGQNYVLGLGHSSGINNNIANITVINTNYLPAYNNHAAAQAAITIANGGVAGNTYLYRETTSNQIGYVSL